MPKSKQSIKLINTHQTSQNKNQKPPNPLKPNEYLSLKPQSYSTKAIALRLYTTLLKLKAQS